MTSTMPTLNAGAVQEPVSRPRDGISRGTKPFHFKFASQKLNWDAILKIDSSRVRREVDIDTLQTVIKNLTYAAVDVSELANFSAARFIHLFQIMQMILQYVLHTQDFLSRTCAQRAKEIKMLTKEVDDVNVAYKQVFALVVLVCLYTTLPWGWSYDWALNDALRSNVHFRRVTTIVSLMAKVLLVWVQQSRLFHQCSFPRAGSPFQEPKHLNPLGLDHIFNQGLRAANFVGFPAAAAVAIGR